MTTTKDSLKSANVSFFFALVISIGATTALSFFVLQKLSSVSYNETSSTALAMSAVVTPPRPSLTIQDYNKRLLALAHVATSSPWHEAFLLGTTTASTTIKRPLWPVVRTYPNAGALLPFNRIVAYYGNFYSKGMGVLGQYPEDVVLSKLKGEVAVWEAADPTTPVIPAIEYIDVTAQASAGKDGKYRLRMPDTQIDRAIEMAAKINGIVILDVQVGLSTLPEELPLLKKYLEMPQVHLAIDPEFSMHHGTPPGRVIGTVDATDVNYAATYLAKLVQDKNLPPKILVVHRFTGDMVTGYRRIVPLPEVQIVIQMDGWGFGAKKINTYNAVIYPEPVQFTGLKLFYKNDLLPPSKALLTPKQILQLTPSPSFIQYQ